MPRHMAPRLPAGSPEPRPGWSGCATTLRDGRSSTRVPLPQLPARNPRTRQTLSGKWELCPASLLSAVLQHSPVGAGESFIIHRVEAFRHGGWFRFFGVVVGFLDQPKD